MFFHPSRLFFPPLGFSKVSFGNAGVGLRVGVCISPQLIYISIEICGPFPVREVCQNILPPNPAHDALVGAHAPIGDVRERKEKGRTMTIRRCTFRAGRYDVS